MLPSREQCLALLKKYRLQPHMVRHCLAVEKVAVFLAKKLQEAGEEIDVGLVSRGALLHDIDKPQTIDSETIHRHGFLGKEILEAEVLPACGEIAVKHRLFCVLEENPFSSWEEKIVYYADKRVRHDQIVSLDARFVYLLERYGKEKEVIEKISSCKPFVEKVEREIFNKLKIDSSLSELK